MRQGRSKEEIFMRCKIDRSSYRRCSVKKSVLKNFANFTGKHLCIPVKFAKFLGTPILKNICERGCGCDVDDMKRTRANASVK